MPLAAVEGALPGRAGKIKPPVLAEPARCATAMYTFCQPQVTYFALFADDHRTQTARRHGNGYLNCTKITRGLAGSALFRVNDSLYIQ